MATKNLGKVAFVFKGDYSSLITYDKYDVTFDGESSFLSTIENNLGHPLSDTNYWKPLCKGNYLAISGKADKTTSVIAGSGLIGGGDLSADRTLNVASANDGITVNADNIQLNAVNNLTSTSTTQPLAANQGAVLKGEIAQLGADLSDNIEPALAEIINHQNGRIKALEDLVKNMLFKAGQFDTIDIVKQLNIWGGTNLVIVGTEAPTIVPDFIGQWYINTSGAGTTYQSKGIVSTSDWKQTSN